MMKKKLINKKGITLIALVITIIVLLILAGVTIATLTEDNGVLTRANDAKTQTENAKEDELRRLTALEAATNIENTEHTETILNEETGIEEPVTVTIPAGFAVSQVEGENSIEDGLVIIDKNGNEFVWVPVSKEDFEIQFQRRPGYSYNNLQVLTSSFGEADSAGNNAGYTENATTQEEAKEMYQSVYDNEGFYIGRYEAGKDKDTNGNVVIQKGAEVYNNVTWSKNKTMNEESVVEGTESNPDGAIELARNFDTANGYTDVTSTLCYGVQWDAVMSFIDPAYKTGTCNVDKSFVANSTGKGNYSEDANTNSWKGNLTSTGASEDYKVKNIYDLAGNTLEWTMESVNVKKRVIRGGNFHSTGTNCPASYRYFYNPSVSNPTLGFRVTLYVK